MRGVKVARLAMEKLMERAERAWAQQADRDIALVFSEASFPDYLNLPKRMDKDEVHAELRVAEKEGALALDWDVRAGEDGQITRVHLLDANLLAKVMNHIPAWEHFKQAEAALAPWRDTPQVDTTVRCWRAGRKVVGLGVSRYAHFVDACRVIDACKQYASMEDVSIRRLSTVLFSDSKRIEAIIPALDALTTDSPDSLSREDEEVLAGLGLVKWRQPILLAGRATVLTVDGQSVRLASPYLGFATHSVEKVIPEDAEYLLTVENYETFNDLSRGAGGCVKGLIIYTGGMPSPAWLRVYRTCLAELPHNISRYHWGDIDLGGFRISAKLADQSDKPLVLWMMSPEQLGDAPSRKMLSTTEKDGISKICATHEWAAIGDAVTADGRAIEQEGINLSLPF